MSRKDKIERVAIRAQKLNDSPEDAALAWKRLSQELSSMADPEAGLPRFNRLLNAIWVAALFHEPLP